MIPEPEVHATKYQVSCLPQNHSEHHHFTLFVEWRGADLWAVCDGFGGCLGADGTWSYEPSPSSRTAEWKAVYRFDLETALALAKEQAPHMTVNGCTIADALARGGNR